MSTAEGSSGLVRTAGTSYASRTPVLVARFAASLGLLVVLGGGGCGSTEDCCGSCPAPEPAVFQLACSSNDLVSVVATGPCATPDASLSSYPGSARVFVDSQSPGACHIELTFATGFTYSTDVTFTTHPGGVCGGPQCTCGDYLAPTSGPFMVNNPSTTCVDAVSDAGASDVAESDADRPDRGCTPQTCAGRGFNCGPMSDGCGGIGQCGTCTSPEYCGGGGLNKCGEDSPTQCRVDLCVPLTCDDYDCGQAGDGCGGLLDCGPCPFSEACSENQCLSPADAGPCVPATCAGLGYDCGLASDGCGSHLECGGCPVAQFCGGGGLHRCGGTCETPDGGDSCYVTCSSADGGTCEGLSCLGSGHTCGEVPNGCGGLLDCGACGGDAGATGAPSEAAVDAQADAGADE